MHWILQWLQSWVRDSHCPILKHILKIATVLSSPAVGSGSELQNNPCWKGPLQVIWGQPLSCLGHICSGPHPVKIWGSPRLKNLQTLWATVPLLNYPQNGKKKILITKSFYHCDMCFAASCPVTVLLSEESGSTFIHGLVPLAAHFPSKYPHILHPQTN